MPAPTTKSPSKLDQFYFDVFVTALEGGIGYWSVCAAYHWQNDGVEDLLGFKALIEVDDEDGHPQLVTRHTIAKGMREIARSNADDALVYPAFRNKVIAALTNPEDADFDASDADAVVQVGLFGSIVYG